MRLFPRFSLRFAWIALTIFLIVFALTINFRQRYLARERLAAHQRSVTRLVANNYAVEVQDKPADGAEQELQIVGLIPPINGKDQGVQAFLDLARPEDLRAIALLFPDLTPLMQDRVFAKLSECRSLEKLYLYGVDLTAEQVKCLQHLSNLRLLNASTIPAQSQVFLRGMKRLEVLSLNMEGYTFEELERFELPNLRVLSLRKCTTPVLRLTKAGFGRFPNLERLVINDSQIEEVWCEGGALPKLEALSLASLAKPTMIGWHTLPEAVPSLRSLAVHASQFGFASREELLRMKNLEWLYFANDVPEAKHNIVRSINAVWVRKEFRNEMLQFREARPEIRMAMNHYDFLVEIVPQEERFSQFGIEMSRERWASDHWLNESLFTRDSQGRIHCTTIFGGRHKEPPKLRPKISAAVVTENSAIPWFIPNPAKAELLAPGPEPFD